MNITEISVCVGTSCFIKGSNVILNRIDELIKENDAEEYIKLRAAFCLAKCGKGVSVKFNEEIVSSVTPDNLDALFYRHTKINPKESE